METQAGTDNLPPDANRPAAENAHPSLQQQDAELLELRRLIEEGHADYEKGHYIEINNLEEHNAFFDELKAELEEFIAEQQR